MRERLSSHSCQKKLFYRAAYNVVLFLNFPIRILETRLLKIGTMYTISSLVTLHGMLVPEFVLIFSQFPPTAGAIF